MVFITEALNLYVFTEYVKKLFFLHYLVSFK